ncbi:unnamed protein product [Darwinula stevensoni]|uniref:MARVEL domain-containing protein n=1 Tax=Darwinula stevensoni TaxID=69355 RepID=A0A7R8XD71_9CRUS|nr:unnamed protein product [Darwinula stevensoni]CAG0892747.1 unnamed protein product [Darwinula stevensoni]
MDVKSLTKPPALFKYAEILLGIVALSLYRAAEKESSYTLRNADEFYVIIGTQLGLFLCNITFPAAYLFGHNPRTIDTLHGGMCALFYLVAGSCLVDMVANHVRGKMTRLVLTSGVFSFFLSIVFIADVFFVGWRWRREVG